MSCADGELKIRYDEKWDYHIYQVKTRIGDKHDRYHVETLKHGQEKEICGNTIEFHRYTLGINIHVKHLRNHEIGGLFNDSRCMHH